MSGTRSFLVVPRSAHAARRAAPSSQKGAVAWIRKNLLATPKDVVLTILAACAARLVRCRTCSTGCSFNAVWTGPDRTFCATTVQGGTQPEGWSGACWAFVSAKFDQFMFGRYPLDERWRPTIVGILFVRPSGADADPVGAAQGAQRDPALRRRCRSSPSSCCIGGFWAFEVVETPLWGGLMVTLVLSFVGIAVSLPLRHPAGARAALDDAGHPNALRHLHRDHPRRSADHRAVHGERDAAAVPADRAGRSTSCCAR